jgi:hypothetical protein
MGELISLHELLLDQDHKESFNKLRQSARRSLERIFDEGKHTG